MQKYNGMIEFSAAESQALKTLIFDAIHECGRIQGWQNSRGMTSPSRWEQFVKADGFSPPWLYHWLKRGTPRSCKKELLIRLARIMRHYKVMIDGKQMPLDYFVTAPKLMADAPQAASPSWVRECLSQMDESDRLEILSWLATNFAHAKRKESIAK